MDPSQEAKYLETCKKRNHWTHARFACTAANTLPLLFLVTLWLTRDATLSEVTEELTWKLTVLGIANLAGQVWLHLMLHMRRNNAASWMFTCGVALASNSMVRSRVSLLHATIAARCIVEANPRPMVRRARRSGMCFWACLNSPC